MNNIVPVFILSLFETGLFSAQLLGKNGIPVYGFDHISHNPGFFSKHIKATLVGDPINHRDALITILIHQSERFSTKPILIAASELYLNFIYEARETLEKYFIINLPSQETLQHIIIKSGQFDLARKFGINVPDYFVVNHPNDLEVVMHSSLHYPLIIKGDAQHKWKYAKLNKSYIVNNFTELRELSSALLLKGVSFIIQTTIPGPITNNYEYNALMLDGKIVESSLIHKIRQYPVPYGAATCVETCTNNEIEEMGRKFVIENGIEGFSNTEFKLDPRDGKYYFIETNVRVWLQIKLTESLGQNFLLSYYERQKKPYSDNKKTIKTVKWVDPFGDLMYLLRVNSTFSGLWGVITSYCNAVTFGLLNITDINPLLKTLKIK